MRTLKIVAAIGVSASLLVYYNSHTRFHAREASLQEQSEQLAALSAEHQRLANLIASAEITSGDDRAVELARLRHEAEALKKQTNDLARKWIADQQPGQAPPKPAPQSHTPEYDEQLRQRLGRKLNEATDLALAFWEYASDHQGQCPSNLDQVASYLAEDKHTLSGTNQFEIVFQGSTDQLDGIPLGSVPVVRDAQIWQTPDGKDVRVYGMGGGSGLMKVFSGDVQSWEAQHIIPPPMAGQAGKN